MGRKKQPDSYRETAALFGVATSSLERWVRQCRVDLSDKVAVGLLLRRRTISVEARRKVEQVLNQHGVATPSITMPNFPR